MFLLIYPNDRLKPILSGLPGECLALDLELKNIGKFLSSAFEPISLKIRIRQKT